MQQSIEKTGEQPANVCLAGGAAAVLGAAEVIHVLCDLPAAQQPTTPEQIEAARIGGHLHWIKLGAESGWPQFRTDRADYPLETVRQEGQVRWVKALEHRFRERVRDIVERSHRIAGAWDRLSDLPFPGLATWSSADLVWL
ncbi:MAG: hypothetical protein ACR2OZ_10600 [Verrucomicrobiales bacterium]